MFFSKKSLGPYKDEIPVLFIVMGQASKFQAWAKQSGAQAWGLTPSYRWVEPAKPELEQPFQVLSPSQARLWKLATSDA